MAAINLLFNKGGSQLKIIKFRGTNSGDGEAFCFDVNRETFVRIVGREPEDWDDYQSGDFVEQDGELRFIPDDPDKCKVYPYDLFGDSDKQVEVEIRVKIL